MEIGGVDLSAIDLESCIVQLPERVQGRVLNADGDIYAYNCAGNDETTHAECVANIEQEVAGRMAQAGATSYILHITGDGSCKGQRHTVAGVREYQANRRDKPKPRNLTFVRQYIKTNMVNAQHYDQEADDGLAQYQQAYLDRGERELCVLDSTDKDLRMVQGLHICPDTGKLVDVQGYGECWYDKDKGKTTGWGTSFFWHQILMGDTADNIPGLPAFGKQLSHTMWPTSPLKEARRRVQECTMPSGKELTEKQYSKAKADVQKLEEGFKCKAAGAVATYEYLKDCDNDYDAFNKIKLAYESHYGCATFEFTDWRGRTFKRNSDQMIQEQAVLLWMRREKGTGDFLNFFREIVRDA